MDIGLAIPQVGRFATLESLRTVAMAAEEAEYTSLWALDRVLVPLAPRSPYPHSADGSLPLDHQSVLDPIVALTTAAAVTERIRVGTNVLLAPLYAPVLLARTAASLDRLSNGRFTLGLGAGWSTDEFEAIGAPRAALPMRMEEILEVLSVVWREDVVDIETSRERVAPSTIGLKPSGGRVPVLLTASSPAGFARVARRADGWTTTGLPVHELAATWSYVLHLAERYGRDPGTMRLVVRGDVTITPSPLGAGRPQFAGSVEEVRGDVERTRDAGGHELVLDLQSTASSVGHLLDLAAQLAAPVVASH
jgi:probable F420-dependent oxidoreductase